METKLEIKEEKVIKDFFPCLFANKDRTIIILASERTSDKTFAGAIIHSTNKSKGNLLGTYSSAWTYQQFSRLPKYSTITLSITQND